MLKLEALALGISKQTGGLAEPESKAFQLLNPGLLRTYRPEKKCDSEHTRIFTSVIGGFKALVADMQAKCSGQSNRLTPDNTLRDLLSLYNFNEVEIVKILGFTRRALNQDSIGGATPLSYFLEEPKVEQKVEECPIL